MRVKGWFGPKRIGYGIGPRSWQGWLATAVVLGGVLSIAGWFHPDRFGLPLWTKPGAVIALGLAYLALVGAAYDPDA